MVSLAYTCVLLATILSAVHSSPADLLANAIISYAGDDQIVEKTFAKGVNQIMTSNLTADCTKIGLNNLAAAKAEIMDTDYECTGALEIAEDVLLIMGQAFDSASDLVADLNTVFNGVPSCYTDNHWYNFVAVINCLVLQVGDIWNAGKHFMDYSAYYMATWDDIQELVTCINNQEVKANVSVESLVRQARLCR